MRSITVLLAQATGVVTMLAGLVAYDLRLGVAGLGGVVLAAGLMAEDDR